MRKQQKINEIIKKIKKLKKKNKIELSSGEDLMGELNNLVTELVNCCEE